MLIHELAARSGVSAKTIRYYESIGILPPARRLPNGYRVYDQTDLERLKLVRGARQLGLSLEEIREVLDLRDRGQAPCTVLLDLLAAKAQEIDRRIQELQHLKCELEELHALGLTFPTDDVEGKHCVCHLVSAKGENNPQSPNP